MYGTTGVSTSGGIYLPLSKFRNDTKDNNPGLGSVIILNIIETSQEDFNTFFGKE